MEADQKPRSPFPTTQWSLIMRAASDDAEDRDKALAEICTLYWPPVYAFIRSRGHPPYDAEDLTQGLFAELLHRNDFTKMDSTHGRLRSYLLTSAKNHLNSVHRNAHRQKRGGDSVLLSIDADTAETRCLIPELVDDRSPDQIFDQQWAITVMEELVQQLSARYAEKQQSDLFTALLPYIQSFGNPPPQRDVANQLNMTEQALRVAVHRLRQRYAEQLRLIVTSTLGAGESVDDEITHLMNSFL
jgi:RNA polymerase sigma-70 factor (ECF subfamily)